MDFLGALPCFVFSFLSFFFCSLSCIRFGRISQRDDGSMGWRAAEKLAALFFVVSFAGELVCDGVR